MLTGKGLTYGGSLARTEATGYGLIYFTREMLAEKGMGFEGKTVVISGSGNVAIYAAEKAMQLGAKVVSMSDSNGSVYDPEGIDLALMKEIKEVKRGRVKEYCAQKCRAPSTWRASASGPSPAISHCPAPPRTSWTATTLRLLVANGCKAVAEGANMPSTPEAIEVFQGSGILYAPGKASNAGGVATSALEMSQNSQRLSWTFDEVDKKLEQIMVGIYNNASSTAKEYGVAGNFVAGANIAGFKKVADAMLAQGIV